MAERELTDDEVRKLGLDQPAPERELSDAEVSALGLDRPAPERVPSPTGWRAPGETKFSDTVRRAEKTDEAMWSALASAAHGPAMAMEGPVNGAIEAVKASNPGAGDASPPSWDKILAAYKDKKTDVEKSQTENLRRFPKAPIVGALLTNPGSAATLPGRLAAGGTQGAMYGLGSSKSDLVGENADPAGAGLDTLKGLGIGIGAAGLGELAQLPGRALAKRAQTLADTTRAAEFAAEQEARAAAVASTRGAYGGEVSSGQRILEMVERAMSDPKADPATAAAARQFLNSPEGSALLNQVLRSNVGRSGDAIGRIQRSQTAMTDAMSKNDPALIQQAADAAANAKLGSLSGVTDRLAELARRNVPPVVGGAIAGPAGAAAGGVVAGALGKPGTIMSNMLKSPSMYRPLTAGAGVGIGTGEAMTRAAPPLAEWSKFLGDEDQPE